LNFHKKILSRFLFVSLAAALPALCADVDRIGAVYTATNASQNSILVYDRMSDGSLQLSRTVSTRGSGSGIPIASQGSMAITQSNAWLLVCNPGSDDISVFSIDDGKAAFAGIYPSGGRYPYSVTVTGNLVYVLNAGISGQANSNVTGFRLDRNGKLTPIPGSTRSLSAPFVDPAQVGLSPDGDLLVVTERGKNLIDVFQIDSTGLPGNLISTPSAGTWPYGFAFGKRNQLFVTEAAAMAARKSTMSSYVVNADGSLTTISAAVPTLQTAACWVVITPGERYAYATDSLTKAITGFSVSPSGALSLINPDGLTGTTTAGFATDAALSNDGRYLYVLSLLGAGMTTFRVESNGSLTQVQSIPLSGFLTGLVAR
jgi:6-phosphogluconolactonase